MKTKLKKRDEKINGRAAYDVLDMGGKRLGHVWFARVVNSGEEWCAAREDGTALTSNGGFFWLRRGAVKALREAYIHRIMRSLREQRLLEAGVEIIGEHYWHGQRRVLEEVRVGNTFSSRALSIRDYELATGKWSGKVYGNGKVLVDYPSEADLLESAVGILDHKPNQALVEYNKVVDDGLKVHEEYAPDGAWYRVGRTKLFDTATEAMRYLLGELFLSIDSVKDALKKMRES